MLRPDISVQLLGSISRILHPVEDSQHGIPGVLLTCLFRRGWGQKAFKEHQKTEGAQNPAEINPSEQGYLRSQGPLGTRALSFVKP